MRKTSALAVLTILASSFSYAGQIEQSPASLPSSAISAARTPTIGDQINLLRAAGSLEVLTPEQWQAVDAQGPAAAQAVRLHAAIAALTAGEAFVDVRVLDAAERIAQSASEEEKTAAAHTVETILGPQTKSVAALEALKSRLVAGEAKSILDSFFAASAAAPEIAAAPAETQLTRAKRIEHVEALAKRDPDAALSHIKATVDDPGERSVEIMTSALRLLAPMAPEKTSSFLIHVIADSKQYYLRREAAKIVAAIEPSLSPASKAEAVAALKKTAEAEEAPLRLMARDVLTRWGVDPGPEIIPEVKKVEPQIIKTPAELKAEQEAAAKAKAEQEYQARRAARPLWKKAVDGVVESAKAHPFPWTLAGCILAALAIAKIFGALSAPFVGFASVAFIGLYVLHQQTAARAAAEPDSSQVIADAMKEFKAKQSGTSPSHFAPIAQRPTTRLTDVAGIDEAREEIDELQDFLKKPEDFAYYGAEMPKGVLLVGPPGTGKTLLARALAGEAGVPFYENAGSDFVEQYVGVGASRVRVMFRVARDNAPAIIFIDEIDAIGGARDDQDNSEWLGTLTAMLSEMDGFDPTKGVVLIGATNRLDSLDPAFRRRFESIIYVGKPDVLGREAILQVHARTRRLGPDVDLHKIAKNTTGLSGSYLRNIVNTAARVARQRNKNLPPEKKGPITQADFNEALERVTMGSARSLIMSKADKERLADHEAGHQLLRLLLDGKANTVTMIPRGNDDAMGYSRGEGDEEDAIGHTADQLKDALVIKFGGIVAEQMSFGNFSTGAGGDLESATKLASDMVRMIGMGKKTGFGMPTTSSKAQDMAAVSEASKVKMDEDIAELKDKAYQRAKSLLGQPANVAARARLKKALLERETLSGEQSAEIAGVSRLPRL